MPKKIASFTVLVAADLGVIILSFWLAYLFRLQVLSPLFPAWPPFKVVWPVFLDKLYLLVAWLAVFGYEKLYTRRRSFWEETRVLLKSSSIAFGFMMIALTFTRTELVYSRWVIFLAWLFSLVLLPGVRRLVKAVLFGLNLWKKRVIIIGSTDSTASIIQAINQNRILGYQIVGCLTDDRALIDSTIAGVTVLGHYDDIEMWQKRTKFEDIIVTFPDIPADRIIALLKRWDGVGETIRYIPRTAELISTGVEIENIGRILSLTIRKNLHKPWNVLIKTSFELVLSLVLSVLLLPVFLLIAAAVRYDSPGPAFFRQARYGKRGRLIPVLKFRSMFKDADARLEAHLRSDEAAREEWARFKKLRNGDPRVTKVGAFLRRHSLDELPQILNVLAGQMSLVGPRPYLQEELEEVKQMKSVLFEAKPGITGLWQISGRSNISFDDRLKLDEHYIRNWSLWLDLTILIKTVGAIVSGSGAF
jgi:Undecaprenyl-phosphate galactose phosphotransferase WbaP